MAPACPSLGFVGLGPVELIAILGVGAALVGAVLLILLVVTRDHRE